jgi:iron-sulfur cluster assembly accessory protein
MEVDGATLTAPVVSLTATATEQLRSMLTEVPENTGKVFRVYVEDGGCSGMQYAMTFDEPRDGDIVAEFPGVRVVVDSFSAGYLRGTVVDFSDALTNGGFKISNPNAKQSCGCGKSFQT